MNQIHFSNDVASAIRLARYLTLTHQNKRTEPAHLFLGLLGHAKFANVLRTLAKSSQPEQEPTPDVIQNIRLALIRTLSDKLHASNPATMNGFVMAASAPLGPECLRILEFAHEDAKNNAGYDDSKKRIEIPNVTRGFLHTSIIVNDECETKYADNSIVRVLGKYDIDLVRLQLRSEGLFVVPQRPSDILKPNVQPNEPTQG